MAKCDKVCLKFEESISIMNILLTILFFFFFTIYMTRPLQTITEIMWPLGTKKSNEKQEVGKVNVG